MPLYEEETGLPIPAPRTDGEYTPSPPPTERRPAIKDISGLTRFMGAKSFSGIDLDALFDTGVAVSPNSDTPVDDLARPLPEEIIWGVPGESSD